MAWNFDGPFAVITDRGVKIQLVETPPPLLSVEITASIQRGLERKVANKLAQHGFRGSRVCFDHVQKMMASSKGDGRSKFAALSVFVGGRVVV